MHNHNSKPLQLNAKCVCRCGHLFFMVCCVLILDILSALITNKAVFYEWSVCCVWSHDHLVCSAIGNESQQNSTYCITFLQLQMQIPILFVIKCLSSEHASFYLTERKNGTLFNGFFSVTLSFFVVFVFIYIYI